MLHVAGSAESFHMEESSNGHGPPVPQLPRLQPRNENGELRRVGVEIEFAGLDLDEICCRLREVIGGSIDRRSDYEAKIEATSLGDVTVELDAVAFRDQKVKDLLGQLHLEKLQAGLPEVVEAKLAQGARWLVPFEIAFAPVEIERLAEFDAVCAAFLKDAEGTRSSIWNAFGLHFNPELPRLDVQTILRYLRAFLCLYEELKTAHDVDLSRRISPFIKPFEDDYARRVLDPAYTPDIGTFIDDYIEANPTRNRPLDLLPVLAWLDERRVVERLPEEKIRKRPTFHYRLPDSRINELGWSISHEWNIWMRVEDLAFNDAALSALCLGRIDQLTSSWAGLGNLIQPG